MSLSKFSNREFTFHYAAYLIQTSDDSNRAEIQLSKLKKYKLNMLEKVRYLEIKNAVKKKLIKQCKESIRKSNFGSTLFSFSKKITNLTEKCSHILYQYWDDMENEKPKLQSCLEHGVKFIQLQNKLIKLIRKYDTLFGIDLDSINQLYSFFYYICEDKSLANRIKDHKVKLSDAICYNEDSPIIHVMGNLTQGVIFYANQACLKLVGLSTQCYKGQPISNYLFSNAKCLQKTDMLGYVIHASKFIISVRLSLLHSPSIATANCSVYSISTDYIKNEISAYVQCNDDGNIIGLSSGIIAYMNCIKPIQYNGSNIKTLFPEISISVLKELPVIEVTLTNSIKIPLYIEKNWAGYLVRLPSILLEKRQSIIERSYLKESYPMSHFEYDPSLNLFLRSFCTDGKIFALDTCCSPTNRKIETTFSRYSSNHSIKKQTTIKESNAFTKYFQDKVEKLFNINEQNGSQIIQRYVIN